MRDATSPLVRKVKIQCRNALIQKAENAAFFMNARSVRFRHNLKTKRDRDYCYYLKWRTITELCYVKMLER